MPTLIDSLIVELSLDPSKFTPKAKEAVDDLNKLEAANSRRSKSNVEGARREAEAIRGLKTQAFELFAIISGGKGFIDFVSGLTDADAAVGRVSRSTGLSAAVISKWQGAARLMGGDAATMAGQFIKLNDAFEGFRHGFGDPQVIANLAGISRAGGAPIDINKGPEETYLALADNLHAIAQREGAGTAGAIGRKFGLDPATLDMLMKGREVTKKILDQIQAMGPATEASADAAGELQRRWNAIFLRTEGTGRQVGIIPDILAASDVLNMKPSEAWAYLNRTDRATEGLAAKPKSLTPGFDASPPPSVGFKSAAEKEAFIRSEAVKRGINPDKAMAVAHSEGFDSFVSNIPGEQSFGAFQLNIKPGAQGDLFRKATGLDPADKKNEAAGILWALDDVKKTGWQHYHGAANGAHLSNWAGIDRSSGGGSAGGTSMTFTGPVSITGVKDVSDMQNKLRDFGLGLKRQADANQSSVGGQ